MLMVHHLIINGDGGCRLWQSVQADSQPKSSGLVLGRRPLGAPFYLHQINRVTIMTAPQTLSWNYYFIIIIIQRTRNGAENQYQKTGMKIEHCPIRYRKPVLHGEA